MGRKTRSKPNTARVFSPLFPDICADDIGSLKIYRHVIVDGRARRVLITRPEYVLPSGEEFSYDPFRTTEGDIEKFFGGGEFFLEPIAHNFKLLPGRGLVIDTSPTIAQRLELVTTEMEQLLENRNAEIDRLTKELERANSALESKSKALELSYKRESEDQKHHREELKKLRDHLQKTIIGMVETREAIVRHAMDPADEVLSIRRLSQIRDGIDRLITKELLTDAFQSALGSDSMSIILGVGGVILSMAYLLFGAKSASAAPAQAAAPAAEGGP